MISIRVTGLAFLKSIWNWDCGLLPTGIIQAQTTKRLISYKNLNQLSFFIDGLLLCTTIADVYSHIIDDDRRLNAERLEAAFYSGRTATPEPVQKVPEVTQDDDTALLMRLLQNPEMSALLKTLAKNL